MKITINGFVNCTQYTWDKTPRFGFSMYKPHDGDTNTVIVMPHSFEIEVPDDFNPLPGQVAALEVQQAKLKQACYDSVMKIEKQINSLLTIEKAA